MVEVRRATGDDVAELVRLRSVMMTAVTGAPQPDGPWQDSARATLHAAIADPASDWAAFVVDHPNRPGTLATCAIGVVERRLPGARNPTGEMGYIFNVATEPDCRRRGYARACMLALLDWYRARGVKKIDLKSAPDGEGLYRSLGFAEPRGLAMTVRL